MLVKLPHLDAHFSHVDRDGAISPDAIAQKIDRTEWGYVLSYLEGEQFFLAMIHNNAVTHITPRPLCGDYAVAGRWVVYLSTDCALVATDVLSGTTTTICALPVDWNINDDGTKVLFRSGGETQVFDLAEGQVVAVSEGHYVSCDHDNVLECPLGSVISEVHARDSMAQYQVVIGGMGHCFVIFQSIYGTIVAWYRKNTPLLIQVLSDQWFVGSYVDGSDIYLCCRSGNTMISHLITQGEWHTIKSDAANDKVEHLTAVAYDAEEIPLTLISSQTSTRKSVVLTVHGGFGVSTRPFSSVTVTDDLSIAFAHVRGGGENGKAWAQAGNGNNKGTALADLISCIQHLKSLGFASVTLSGASHGGWLSILAGLSRPDLVDKVCATAPIVDLEAYFGTDLGKKHRAEFADDVSGFDPSALVTSGSHSGNVDLLVVAGKNDHIVDNQNYDDFVAKWNAHRGNASLVTHQGGHYSPPGTEVAQMEKHFQSFVHAKKA